MLNATDTKVYVPSASNDSRYNDNGEIILYCIQLGIQGNEKIGGFKLNKYMVIKVTKQGKGMHSAVFLDLESKKRKHISGNFPDLYTNMIIGLELDGDFATDYELELTEKNVGCLNRFGVNVDVYQRTLQAHDSLKEKGITWRIAALDYSVPEDDVYNDLPFPEADKVHKEMVNNPTDEKRLKALSKETLEIARSGHRKIAYGIEEFLGYFSEAEREGAYQQLMIQLKILCLKAESYTYNQGKVWDNEMKHKEDFVRQNIHDRLETDYPLCATYEIEQFVDTINKNGSYLCTEQKNAIWTLDNSLPCVITGGAGVGKTSVIQAIIDCYSQFYGREHILLIAPTGKASRRLAEKTSMPAMTIHRALRKVPDDDFVYYHSSNPLPHRLVIVDESSMVDTSLMYDLLSAVSLTTKIIFVGDHNQLYPVGYGEPFFDFLQTLKDYKCVYWLKENHRQEEGTDILKTAEDILANRPLCSGNGVVVGNITWNEVPMYFPNRNEKNVQILSPYNDFNSKVNEFMRNGEGDLNVGDKVIALKNTKDYCNGDIGYITAVNTRKGTVTIDFEGRSVVVTKAHRFDIGLAYAITVHKMQGSEADRIIVFIPKNDRFVEKRMLYTAVTRAKKQLEIYYY